MTGSTRRRNRKRSRVASLRRGLRNTLLILLTLNVVSVLALRWVTPPGSMVILQRTLTEDRPQYHRWTAIEQLPPHVALAVVAAEDQKFPDHAGFDLQSIHTAIGHHARGGRLRGASTLSQQVARNLFLWQGRSYLRKGLEAWFTVLIELLWPKQRILEVYLNIAETGPQTFGVETAARRFLGTTAADLTRGQAALIAAVLPSPRRLLVASPSVYVRERQQHILQQMELLGDSHLAAVLD